MKRFILSVVVIPFLTWSLYSLNRHADRSIGQFAKNKLHVSLSSELDEKNQKSEVIQNENESIHLDSGGSIIQESLQRKKIPLELARSMELATLKMNVNLPDFQGSFETDFPVIEQELRTPPFPGDLTRRWALLLQLSTLINSDRSQLPIVRKVLFREMVQPSYSELQGFSQEERALRLKILLTALQLNTELANSFFEAFQETCKVMENQTDLQTRAYLADQFSAMNPGRQEDIRKCQENDLHRGTASADSFDVEKGKEINSI